MDDAHLAQDVRRVAEGDADALQRLIVRHHGPLQRVIASQLEPGLRRLIDPDDVLQNAYVTAFRKVGECTFAGPAAFYRWLEAIAVSRLADTRRELHRQKRDVARHASVPPSRDQSSHNLFNTLAGGESTPSRKLARAEAVAAVLSSLARLSDDRRAVLQMRFLENRPVREIAAELGKTEAAVHQLCSRGLASLRTYIQPLVSRSHPI
jgi:RNA polymerase sigma-70 factor (ECF subfamily)